MKKLPAHLKSQHETRQTGSNVKIWRAATILPLFAFFYLLFAIFPIPAHAACTPSDCSPGSTCRYDYFYPDSAKALQPCFPPDSATPNCFCYPDSTPPPPLPPPSPSPSPSPTPPPGPSPYPSLTCDPNFCSKSGIWAQITGRCDRDSRPAECNICNQTGLFCPSCATSFTVHDTVSYLWEDGTPEEPHCVERNWKGTVTINASGTTIPFVGFKGGEDETKYLADYFEGTHDYYRTYPLFGGLIHGVSSTFLTNFQGVLRKLTPMQYQDELKKDIIENRIASPGAPQEGKVHNYQLNYVKRLCWDAPLWAEVLKTIAEKLGLDIPEITHYCLFRFNWPDDGLIEAVKIALDEFNSRFPLFKIPYSYQEEAESRLADLVPPPDPSEENYVEKWNAWKELDGGKWWKLWQVTPMVSREDTPGYIAPYLGWKPDDTPRYIAPRVDKVPHVARLYEASQEVNNILMPYQGEVSFVQKKTEPIIASAKEGVLGEKTLLALASGCIPCNCKVFYPSPTCDCMEDIKPDGQPNCEGEALGTLCTIHLDLHGGCICGYTDCSPAPPGCECCLPMCSDYGEPTPSGVCGLAGARSVGECEQLAITDTNPNDTICGPEIAISLSAVDRFINYNYTPCKWDWVCKCLVDEICDPQGKCVCPVTQERCRLELINPWCHNITVEEVSRRFGINLSHPYLTEIWEQTGKTDTNGLFNFFRLATIPEFTEIDAASQISYQYKGDPADPSTGKFYYNYLGGVQLAKEWLIRALTPHVE